jgi:hypothetical protein
VKFRSTAVGAAAATAVAAALIATLASHPIATASAHPAARWSATWASAMQPPVAGNLTTGPNWSDGFSDQTVRQVIRVSAGGRQVRDNSAPGQRRTGVTDGPVHADPACRHDQAEDGDGAQGADGGPR